MTPLVHRYADEIGFWHGVGPRDIFSRSRRQSTASARADVMRRLRSDGFSLSQIGRWQGRDHTTVLFHLKKGADHAR